MIRRKNANIIWKGRWICMIVLKKERPPRGGNNTQRKKGSNEVQVRHIKGKKPFPRWKARRTNSLCGEKTH